MNFHKLHSIHHLFYRYNELDDEYEHVDTSSLNKKSSLLSGYIKFKG